MKLTIKKGRTSLLVKVFLQSSVDGSPLTGLTNASAGLVCYRARDDDGNAGGTAVALSAGTRGTWSSGGFVEKDSANMPGVYELGLPDAGQATGSETVLYVLKGATNLAACPLEIQLVAFDPQSANLGLSNVSANVTQINSVSTSPVTTINANIGTTQPLNFMGTGANAFLQAANGIRSATAQAGGTVSTIVLDAGASATDNWYQDQIVTIVAGTGAGQSRSIQTYIAASKVANIYPNWVTIPDATSVFLLHAHGQVDVGNLNNSRTDNNSATLSLASLNIQSPSGTDAVFLKATGSSGRGLNVQSANSDALQLMGGAASDGLRITAGPTGNAIDIIAGSTSGKGINLSTTSGIGIDIANAGTGPCVRFTSSSAAGFVVNTNLANSNAVNITGNGTGAAIQLAGGATGPGAIIKGGGTSGDGLQCSATVGNAITAALIQGDLGGRILGNTATAFSGQGVIDQGAPTAAQIATQVWTDLTAGSDFATAGSIGALLKNFTFTGGNVNPPCSRTFDSASSRCAVRKKYSHCGCTCGCCARFEMLPVG